MMKYNHYPDRAAYIHSSSPSKSICVAGAGNGETVKELWELNENAVGIDIAIANDYVYKISAQAYDYGSVDVIYSWNLLDCLDAKQAVEVAAAMGEIPQYHVVCLSDDDPDAQDYIDQGYYIQSRAYWEKTFPYATIIAYKGPNTIHGVPLSWGRTS